MEGKANTKDSKVHGNLHLTNPSCPSSAKPESVGVNLSGQIGFKRAAPI